MSKCQDNPEIAAPVSTEPWATVCFCFLQSKEDYFLSVHNPMVRLLC